MTIWKFKLEIEDEQTVMMPMQAKVLSVAEQGGDLCLWAMVDPINRVEPRRVRIVGTGHEMFWSEGKFVGTVLTEGGRLVWHVFVEDK